MKRVNSRGDQKVDPTIYLGSGGVTYGLFRVTSLPADALNDTSASN